VKTTTFAAKAPRIMRRLMSEFKLSPMHAAAIVGNLAHESNGFRTLQEVKPTVAGSRGGYGWAQWTGPRRREFEEYCRGAKLSPASDEANMGFLIHELRWGYNTALVRLRRTTELREAVIAFEMAYERAGVKHYDSRLTWARKALSMMEGSKLPSPPDVEPIVIEPAPKKAGFFTRLRAFFTPAKTTGTATVFAAASGGKEIVSNALTVVGENSETLKGAVEPLVAYGQVFQWIFGAVSLASFCWLVVCLFKGKKKEA
jgi:hypothetical protein